MVAHGIAVEKHGLLAQQAQAAREHQARISEQQGKTIAALIRAFMESCGLPMGTPGVGAVMRELLGQCREGEPSPLSPAEAGKARAEIRAAVLAEPKAEGLVVARPELPAGEEDGARGLPAPQQTTHEAEEGAGMLSEVRRGMTFREAARAPCERR